MFGSNFGNNNQANSMFGNTNQTTGFFNNTPNVAPTGTVIKFVPSASTDTIQKGGQNHTVQTKIHSISAMKEYESKSFEELRLEDYLANRIAGNNSTMFGNTNTGVFNNPNSTFTSFGNTITPQNQSAFGNSQSLFGTTNSQANTAFGNKSLFGQNTNTSTTSTFGTISNNTSKPNMFGNLNTSTAQAPAKPLFGGVTNSSTGLFNSTTNQLTNQPTAGVFGSNNFAAATTQQSSFFGSVNNKPQTTQATGLFGTANAGNSSFGFGNTAPNNTSSLFGATNNVAKPFVNTSFGFNNNTNTPPTGLFNNASSGNSGLFGTNTQSTAFGCASKPGLFPSTNTFSTAQPIGATQSLFQPATGTVGAFGGPNNTANSNLFSNQQKPLNTFGGGSGNLFNTNASQAPTLFGGTAPANPNFCSNLTTNQPFNSFNNTGNQVSGISNAITTVTPIGYNDPSEALMQQKISQMKFLNLIGNRPYGVNKLFLGVNTTINGDNSNIANDNNSKAIINKSSNLSLAIKRNDAEQNSLRRRVLNSRRQKMTSHKVFSGFDDDDNDVEDDQCNKSNTSFDKSFFTKREDWKYLPPNAFEKSRRSINSSNSMLNESVNKENKREQYTINHTEYSILSNNHKDALSTSTPLVNMPLKKTNLMVSPIEKGSEITSNPSYNGDMSLNASDLFNDSFALSSNKVVKDCSLNSIVETSYKLPDDECICGVILSKPGYYVAPEIRVMNELVTESDNANNNKECWVKDLIIGRKDYGSIRFIGHTNVYGLNLDELVDIKRSEVSVYPNDVDKPDVGEGLNKRAQVVLHKVYPTDKSTGLPLTDVTKLIDTNFEARLRRATKKMEARFISYNPKDGLWIFEVDHFSKYKFDDSDDDEDDNNCETKTADGSSRVNNTTIKTEDLPIVQQKKINSTSTTSLGVVSAEADSMSESINYYSNNLFNSSHNGLQSMRKCLARQDSDEDINNDLFHSNYEMSTNNSQSANQLFQHPIDQEEPVKKRFETCEMGQSIFNSINDQHNLTLVKLDSEMDYEFPHIPISSEPIAETREVITKHKYLNRITIPQIDRNIEDLGSLYIPDLLKPYLGDLEQSKNPDNHYLESEFYRTNRFRIGLSISNNGFKIISKTCVDNLERKPNILVKNVNKKLVCKSNGLHIQKLRCDENRYQEQLLESVLSNSSVTRSNSTSISESIDTFPLWMPNKGLNILNSLSVFCDNDNNSEHNLIFRIITLCKALWGNLTEMDDNNALENTKSLSFVGRKQALAHWLRLENRSNLQDKVSQYLNSRVTDQHFHEIHALILESLSTGELELAIKLSIMTKHYRLSLILAQISGNGLNYRNIMKQQLCIWLQTRTDIFIPIGLLKIYALLSGQTSVPLSDGSIIYPLENMKWTQALGCFIWFIQPYMASVSDIINSYEVEFNSLNIPEPWPIGFSNKSSSKFYDSCFFLIKLYCDNNFDLDKVLNPSTMSLEPKHTFAYSWFESWFLSTILHSLEFSCLSRDRICLEYANEIQCQENSRWFWSVFVLSNISDKFLRQTTIKHVIERNVSDYSTRLTTDEEFLVKNIYISPKQIYKSKAILAKYNGDLEREAENWLKAGYVDCSHSLYVDKIMPKLMINDNFDHIFDILQKFVDCQAHEKLSAWLNGGDIYLKYIKIVNEIRSLKLTNKLANYTLISNSCLKEQDLLLGDSESLDIRLSKTKSMAVSLKNAIGQFDVSSSEKRICQSQIIALCNSVLDVYSEA